MSERPMTPEEIANTDAFKTATEKLIAVLKHPEPYEQFLAKAASLGFTPKIEIVTQNTKFAPIPIAFECYPDA